jgi:hypothetical protein
MSFQGGSIGGKEVVEAPFSQKFTNFVLVPGRKGLIEFGYAPLI